VHDAVRGCTLAPPHTTSRMHSTRHCCSSPPHRLHRLPASSAPPSPLESADPSYSAASPSPPPVSAARAMAEAIGRQDRNCEQVVLKHKCRCKYSETTVPISLRTYGEHKGETGPTIGQEASDRPDRNTDLFDNPPKSGCPPSPVDFHPAKSSTSFCDFKRDRTALEFCQPPQLCILHGTLPT
jgi:hypothetical protein